MALEGNLSDFGISEILQKIDEQGKTGILTIYSGEDTVTVTFLNGAIVAATNTEKRPEDRLGNFLVLKGYLSEENLNKALADQEQSFDRLGQILLKKRLIDKETLQTALREQVAQIVKRLLNLNQGFYHFKVEEKVHYDQENMTPLRVEQVLMSGFEDDEKVEKLLKSFPSVHTKLVKTRKADEHIMRELKLHGDIITSGGRVRSNQLRLDNPMLSPFEKRVIKSLEDPHSIQQLITEYNNNRKDVLEALKSLRENGFIEEYVEAAPKQEPAEEEYTDFDDFYAEQDRGSLLALVPFLLSPLLIIGILLFGGNPLRPFQNPGASAYTDFQRIELQICADSILTALRMSTYDNKGQSPLVLSDLVTGGYLDEDLLTDPYGTPFRYDRDTFTQIASLTSAGPDGQFAAQNPDSTDDIVYAAAFGEYRNPPAVLFPPSMSAQDELLKKMKPRGN